MGLFPHGYEWPGGGSGNNRSAIPGGTTVRAIWIASGTLLTAILPQVYQALGVAVLVLRRRGLQGEEAVVSRNVKK